MIKFFVTDSDGSFSWRKAGTGLCFLLFTISVIGYLIKHGFDELPDSYMYIITLVFVFYFLKKPLENISFSVKPKDDKSNG